MLPAIVLGELTSVQGLQPLKFNHSELADRRIFITSASIEFQTIDWLIGNNISTWAGPNFTQYYHDDFKQLKPGGNFTSCYFKVFG